MNLRSFLSLLLVLFLSCDPDPKREGLPCNNLLAASCGEAQDVPYCTFGFKFGNSNPFSPAGPETPGPTVPVSEITFKFQDPGLIFKTHSESHVTSLTFSEAHKSAIREAISEWSAVADITFVEKNGNEKTDVTIIRADIEQGGLGYPAFPDEPCSAIAGYLIIGTRTTLPGRLALHEMGHVLGLGHVTSDNMMNPNKVEDLDQLQPGDIAGVQSIYGIK